MSKASQALRFSKTSWLWLFLLHPRINGEVSAAELLNEKARKLFASMVNGISEQAYRDPDWYRLLRRYELYVLRTLRCWST